MWRSHWAERESEENKGVDPFCPRRLHILYHFDQFAPGCDPWPENYGSPFRLSPQLGVTQSKISLNFFNSGSCNGWFPQISLSGAKSGPVAFSNCRKGQKERQGRKFRIFYYFIYLFTLIDHSPWPGVTRDRPPNIRFARGPCDPWQANWLKWYSKLCNWSSSLWAIWNAPLCIQHTSEFLAIPHS